MIEWLAEIRKLQAAGRDCVRVTVMDARGSAPREIGATMLVTAEEVHGSIGGGQLEYECTRIAAAMPEMCLPPSVRTFPLGATLGQCCGGVVDVLFEFVPAQGADWLTKATHYFASRTPAVVATSIAANGASSRAVVTEADLQHANDAVIEASRRMFAGNSRADCVRSGDDRTLLEPIMGNAFAVALFGAGHVGSALVSVLAHLDCNIRWIDGRRDIFPSSMRGNVTTIESADPAREVMAMPVGSYYLVMTHSHALDYEICEQVLTRDDFAYCGLIGSRTKRRRFEKRMRSQGMPETKLEKLTCPIGIGGVDGKRPGEIAVAVAAELLTIRQLLSACSIAGEGGSNVRQLRR